MKKNLIAISLLFVMLIPALSYSDDLINTNIQTIPDYNTMMTINSFLPGYAQLAMGKTGEGLLYMTSLPLLVMGSYLLLDYMLNDLNYVYYARNDMLFVNTNNHAYFFYNEAAYNNPNRWKLYVAVVASVYSSLMGAYSSYDAKREYINKYGIDSVPYPVDTNKIIQDNLIELITAPWKPENVFNWDFFPVYPLLELPYFTPDNLTKIGNYFKQDSVNFLGAQVHPLAGLGLVFTSAVLLVTANAAFEEIFFRGTALEESGLIYSSLLFGSVHLVNMLMPNTSVESTIVQTIYATCFGFYAAHKTMENGYDIKRMIALHFWHNVTAMVFNYLVEPDQQMYFSINIPIRF